MSAILYEHRQQLIQTDYKAFMPQSFTNVCMYAWMQMNVTVQSFNLPHVLKTA